MANSVGLPLPQRTWAMLVVALGISLAVIDSVIANVALPTIARTLHADPATSIWIINAYQLAITISLLPLSSLGDMVGYRRVYLGGVVLFTVASFGCALSDSLLTLTLARVAQGFGAAGIMSVNTALIRVIYPPHMLGRGISTNAAVVAAGTALGPTLAAGILSVANWPWLFAINVPLGLAAFTLGVVALPHNRGKQQRYDYLSALLNALTFGMLIVSLDGFGHGQNRPFVIAELVATVLIGTVFVRRQLNRPTPLLPVDLLRNPIFALSVGTSICSFAAQMLAFVSVPFYLQDTLGFSTIQTGLLMTPWPVAIIIVAPLSGYLSDRYSAGLLGGVGLLGLALGLASLAFLPAHPSSFEIGWRMALCGAGFALFQSPNNRTLLSSAPRERSGAASGMLSTSRLVGQTLGATMVALIFGLVGDNHGGTVSLGVGASFAALAAIISLTRLAKRENDAGHGPGESRPRPLEPYSDH